MFVSFIINILIYYAKFKGNMVSYIKFSEIWKFSKRVGSL